MPIKNGMRKLLWPIVAFRRLFILRNAYLKETGWFNSVKQSKPVTKDGQPLPWMNYAVISFLNERIQNHMVAFEFGSGYSTLYFAKRVKEITSIEYNKEWYEMVRKSLPNNAKLLLVEEDRDGDYCRSINTLSKPADLIIIDGRDRINCLKQSFKNLSEAGVVVFDDSHREKYSEAFSTAGELGFKCLNLSGIKPTGYEIEQSTIFYRDGNCLDI
jgi:hypothetical protein